MIYSQPKLHEPLDQGDLIDECPVFHVKAFSLSPTVSVEVNYELRRVVVVTQACDLPNEKTTTVNVAEVFDARQLIDQGVLKAADIKGPIRAGRV